MASISLVRLMSWNTFRPRKPKPEETLCQAFANELRAHSLDGNFDGIWTHVPNEIGWSNSKVAMMIYAAAKAMGMIVGASDYVFLGKDRSLALEAKSKTGKQNPYQVDFEAWCKEQDVPYRVFRTVEEGLSILREHGFIKEPAR